MVQDCLRQRARTSRNAACAECAPSGPSTTASTARWASASAAAAPSWYFARAPRRPGATWSTATGRQQWRQGPQEQNVRGRGEARPGRLWKWKASPPPPRVGTCCPSRPLIGAAAPLCRLEVREDGVDVHAAAHPGALSAAGTAGV